MDINLSNLGEIIKINRKSKSYSTRELADKLNVSAGLINNIENAKNDVFKLELMINIIDELDIPIHEILTSLFVQNVDKNDTSIKEYLDLISFQFIDVISKYENKEKAAAALSDWLLSTLSSIKALQNLS